MKSPPQIRLLAGASPAARLTSWKEIAAYLGRDARTVQMWEKQEGLPIHRHSHQSRSSVYAYPEELDAWLRMRRPGRQAEIEAAAPAAEPATEKPRWAWLTGGHYPMVAVVLLFVIAGAVFWFVTEHRALSKPSARVLAVLPFENLSASKTDDFLVDELTDGLITEFSRTGQIQVVSRRSAMQFKGQHIPLPEIAARLHARLVLDGTVARSGEEIRITAQLLDAEQERPLWANSYSGKTRDFLAFQEAVAATISSEVAQKLSAAALPARMASQPAANPQARLAYLTGRYFLSQRDEPGLNKGMGYFRQAAAIDPRYALPHSGLADAYSLMSVWGKTPAREALSTAKAEAQTALSLDPSCPEAYSSLAFVTYRQDWDFASAERYFRKAIELDPNSVVAHQWYGEFLGDLRGFDQSIAELLKARELDPLSAIVGSDLADGYLHAGRYAEAEAELRRIQNLYPDFAPAHAYLASVYLALENYAAAEVEAQAYFLRTGDETLLTTVRIERLAAMGKVEQARDSIRRRLNQGDGANSNPYQRAQLYFATGQKDAGYAALDQAYRARSWWLVTMLVDPGFLAVRNEPRFRDLARRVGLPA
ncbi:MAG: hypothetical protein ACP5FH_02610 [Terracidiphilus sp.]